MSTVSLSSECRFGEENTGTALSTRASRVISHASVELCVDKLTFYWCYSIWFQISDTRRDPRTVGQALTTRISYGTLCLVSSCTFCKNQTTDPRSDAHHHEPTSACGDTAVLLVGTPKARPSPGTPGHAQCTLCWAASADLTYGALPTGASTDQRRALQHLPRPTPPAPPPPPTRPPWRSESCS